MRRVSETLRTPGKITHYILIINNQINGNM